MLVHEVTLIEMAESCGLAEEEVRELLELGLVSPDADCLVRLRKATRIQRDLELEPPALGVLLAFLAQIDELEARVRELSAQLQRPRI